jgi:hypothetical protein
MTRPGDKTTIHGVRHSGSPTPKYSECENQMENFPPRFCGIKTVLSSLVIFQRPIYQLGVLPISAGVIEEHIEGKTSAAGSSPFGSCSCTIPRLTGDLPPRRKWPTYASSVLITHTILRFWPRRNITCYVDWKSIWNVAIFLPTRREFLPPRRGWTKFWFFKVPCKR